MEINKIFCGHTLDVLKTFPDESINCIVTSPPYWGLRSYDTEPVVWGGNDACKHQWDESRIATIGRNDTKKMYAREVPNLKLKKMKIPGSCKNCKAWQGELGHEPTPDLYISHLIMIFEEIKRVLMKNGTCWVNLMDTYTKIKSQALIPERFSIAMFECGWLRRNEIIWQKPSNIPESNKDRFTVDFEKLFFFTKSGKYYFEQQFEPGIKDLRNKRSVWSINKCNNNFAHFAVYPLELIKIPIQAGCPKGGIVLDPFMGVGTTAKVARALGRNFVGIELNPEYISIANSEMNLPLFREKLEDQQVQEEIF